MFPAIFNPPLILAKCYLVEKFIGLYQNTVSSIKNSIYEYFENKPEKGLIEENCFLFLEHLFFFFMGYSMFWKEDWFYDIDLTWVSNLDAKIVTYYLFYTTRYIVQTKMMTGNEKDYNSMLLHHISTISLLILSFIHYHRIGTIIAFTHDLVDLFFLPSKILHKFYSTKKIYLFNILSYLFFACFFIIFFITRIYYNSKIIINIYNYVFYPFEDFLFFNPLVHVEGYILLLLLLINLSIQLYWQLLIFKFVYNLSIGEKPKDEKGNQY